jgi:hypothetical protein
MANKNAPNAPRKLLVRRNESSVEVRLALAVTDADAFEDEYTITIRLEVDGGGVVAEA